MWQMPNKDWKNKNIDGLRINAILKKKFKKLFK